MAPAIHRQRGEAKDRGDQSRAFVMREAGIARDDSKKLTIACGQPEDMAMVAAQKWWASSPGLPKPEKCESTTLEDDESSSKICLAAHSMLQSL